jgi:hypothetical protein
MQGGKDFIGGCRVIFWSRLSSGFRLEGDGGRSRGRGRSHYEKRKIKLLMAEERRWLKESYEGQIYKDEVEGESAP